ncbi:MAG: ribonucleoside-diphosphate reductase, adenosylcobalamin-dependent [Candidatus Tagabacteria bacterium RIFCSPLOWO2_01_FULL_39_11]|uniref:Vitamin B12-dependent ribonucleotide reductase n=1 Tax=Candidatus Tagabacteria bacterium RIFCSPLOWO2_01_FULL_39_11 TaxID=1802295 RepID=A0A1G2LU58_9BACT|nr:MAG: ribonucleoside-diphosphate reductase, adenosylcobalamin-dependent [Candidatus Tagabacteria bacterium RIFCSPLOWO2_01_FULL_39_11]
MVIKQIKKRDGRIAPFDKERIINALFKAFEASGEKDGDKSIALTETVIEKLIQKYRKTPKKIPAIEEIQDLVEETLIENGYAKVAKTYILYRQKRAEIRKEKQIVLDKEEIDDVDKLFDLNALRVLRSRYLKKDSNDRVIESPKELFLRVAIHAALTDIIYDEKVFKFKELKDVSFEGRKEDLIDMEKASFYEGKLKIGKYFLNRFHIQGLHRAYLRFRHLGMIKVSWEKLIGMLKKNKFSKYEETIDDFYNVMVKRRFLPNTPALANFGNYLGMGSACFALDVDDSIDSIMDTLKNAAIIFKSGGGLGYNFSKLRPKGDFIKTTGGTSSGPLSFMRLFDTMTEVVKQGGIRRGANMGIMNSSHPDIEDFITIKEGNKALRNFNISVLITPDFWEYYKADKPYPLVNPKTGKIVNTISSRYLFEKIVYQAWESAEPGVIFHDHLNKHNPFLKHLGPIVTTNPCGELPLYSSESCNLGSINLWSFIKHDNHEGKRFFDWQELENTVKIASRFLDNVIDINFFPLTSIEEMTMKTRKIGLGIMGVGDLLFDLEVQFDSQKGREMMEKIMEFINYHSKIESIEMAKHRGKFPYYEKSFYPEEKLPFSGFYDKNSWSLDWSKVVSGIKKYGIRNSVTTVIAPTGSISMIAGCSSGIEPVYSLIFQKNVAVGSFYYVDSVFESRMLREGLFDEDLIKDVVKDNGSLQNIPYIPPKLKKVFVTAHDISPEDHIRTLAAFQKWVDSSISKTNNFPANATAEYMKKSYMLAYELGCKDVTVFRDKSIKDQVLIGGAAKTTEKKSDKIKDHHLMRVKDEKAEGPAIYKDPAAVMNNDGASNNGELSAKGKITKCPNCSTDLSFKEGCASCPICGWGLCV